jgi:hypothetical protein
MKPATATTRVLALFVVGFLCLNAGAFLCLAYCGKAMAAATAESCPLKKAGISHCPHSQAATKDQDDASFAGSSVTCCMLPVGVFGAPLESKSGTITSVAVTTAIEKTEFVPVVLAASRQIPKFYYRPPPNDARLDRVRNQVFRI